MKTVNPVFTPKMMQLKQLAPDCELRITLER